MVICKNKVNQYQTYDWLSSKQLSKYSIGNITLFCKTGNKITRVTKVTTVTEVTRVKR